MTTIAAALPVMRWCYRCPQQFEVDPRFRNAKICPSCAASHPDNRIRRQPPAATETPPDAPAAGARTRGADWRDDAACRREDPELWFPIGKGVHGIRQYDRAREICRACPVIADCERWAAAVRPEYGMLAGLTPEERRSRHGEPIRALHISPRTRAVLA